MRLIDADKGLISKIQRKTGCNFITAQEIVDSMPTIEERKVGKWVTNPNKMKGTEIECNKCGVSALSKIGIQVCSEFCPHCGSRMESEE